MQPFSGRIMREVNPACGQNKLGQGITRTLSMVWGESLFVILANPSVMFMLSF